MAITHVRTEERVHVMAFAEGFIPFSIARDESVDYVCERTEQLPFMRMDCSLPLLYALEHRRAIDLSSS